MSCSQDEHWVGLRIEATRLEASGVGLKIDYNKKDSYYFHVAILVDHVPVLFPQGDLEKFRTLWYGGINIEGDMLEA